MTALRILISLGLLAATAGCATSSDAQPARSAPSVEVLGRTVDSLAAETAQRLTTDPYRGLAVVVRASGQGIEAVVAELLRTRLLERSIAVEVACPAKCVEVSMVEFAADTAIDASLAPGQVVNLAAGTAPSPGVVAARSGSERSNRSTGLLITFAARDGNRFLARSHAMAILAVERR